MRDHKGAMLSGSRGADTKWKHSLASSSLQDFSGALRPADVLLIVPPFHVLDMPSYAVHLLQACCGRAGIRVQVLYANFLLASLMGEKAYERICDASVGWFAGERFFARCAFGLPRLGRRARRMFKPDWVIGRKKRWAISPDFNSCRCRGHTTWEELLREEACAEGFVDAVASAVCQRHYRVVGCTTIFQQMAASVALLNRIKARDPDTITVLGGANCEGDMAKGIASLGSRIDYIFSGECEEIFPRFVRAVLDGHRPQQRLLFGGPCGNMDDLPTPRYTEFDAQRRRFLPSSEVQPEETQIPYETSRGCWWGEKHNCTFCGLNGERMAFRQKSPDRVITDLRSLLTTYPTRTVVMTDNILPHKYFQTLLPRLDGMFKGISIFYEAKANLSLPQVLALKRAGVMKIQPGIESLSSRLLALMKKGVWARQNLTLLRYARAAGLFLDWIILWGLPGDDVEAYREMLTLFPLLHHLQPPCAMAHLSIERFSPYFSSPAEFGVRDIKPLAGYYDWTPAGADVDRIAYHFTAKYRCGAHDHPEVIQKLWQEMVRWQATWRRNGDLPGQDLKLVPKRPSYRLVDTRDLWRRKRDYVLSRDEARALATARPYSGSGLETWALREKLAVNVDGWFVPLAVADPETLLELTQEQDVAQHGRSWPHIHQGEPMLSTKGSLPWMSGHSV